MDSADGIVYEAGSQVEPPRATCEEQVFVYGAKLMFAEVLGRLDRKEQARRLFRVAGEPEATFHDAFWMEKEGFIAFGLDLSRRPKRIGRTKVIRLPAIASGRRFIAWSPWREFFFILWLLLRDSLR